MDSRRQILDTLPPPSKRNMRSRLLAAVALLATLGTTATVAVLTPSSSSVADVDDGAAVADTSRLDCCPEGNHTTNACSQSLCTARNCCWLSADDDRVPWCFFASHSKLGGYALRHLHKTSYGISGVLRRTAPSNRGRDLTSLAVDIFHETDTRVHVRIADAAHKRFVAPYPELPATVVVVTDRRRPLYNVVMSKPNEPFWFQVRRRDGDGSATLFDTKKVSAPLIFTDQFIQLSGKLPARTNGLYGLGQHFTPLRLDFDWQSRFVFWNSDGIPTANVNLYASQPFYMDMADNDDYTEAAAHGVYFHNSGALEVALNPDGTLAWRALSGVIDLYFFLGPTPADVVQQYTELVGRPAMPPYWALGFHLCRYGYGSLNQTRYINSINRAAGIPVEAQWNDIDALHADDDFTYDKKAYGGLPRFVDELHRDGLRYVIMTDPGINAGLASGSYEPYDFGHELDVFIKNATGHELLGESWTGNATVWPDFTHPNAPKYWSKMLRRFHREIGFDGLWIDMNEPSNFVSGSDDGCPLDSSLEHPAYVPPNIRTPRQLYGLTLCMTAKQHAGLHYNLHNAYGLTENRITYKALTEISSTGSRKRRPFVFTRSNFAGSGRWAGTWNGDGRATWTDMRLSIAYILNYNMFGMPLVGVDLCGFHTNTTQDLCARWSQLGAFYPFVRSHNDLDLPDKDPASMGEPVLSAARQALRMRYRLLPYFYTLFYQAHTQGATVARPLFFEFPTDPIARYCDWQFMIGNALMVIPVLQPLTTWVAAYLPPDAEWYDYYTGQLVNRHAKNATWTTLNAPYDKINLLQRANTIIVEQDYANSTRIARLLPFRIQVALPRHTRCNEDGNATVSYDKASRNCAQQSLYVDDGDSLELKLHNLIEFEACGCRLSSRIRQARWIKPENPMLLASVRINGLLEAPHHVTVNNEPASFSWSQTHCVLHVEDVNLDLLQDSLNLQFGGI